MHDSDSCNAANVALMQLLLRIPKGKGMIVELRQCTEKTPCYPSAFSIASRIVFVSCILMMLHIHFIHRLQMSTAVTHICGGSVVLYQVMCEH